MAATLGHLSFTGKVVGTTKANEHMPATTFSGKVTTSGGLDSPGNATMSGTLLVRGSTDLKGPASAHDELFAHNNIKGLIPFTTYAGADGVEYDFRNWPASSWLDTSSASIRSFRLDADSVDGKKLVLVAEDRGVRVGTWRWVERYQTGGGGSGSGTPAVVSVSKGVDTYGTVYGQIVLNGKRLFWNDREIVVGEGGVLKLA